MEPVTFVFEQGGKTYRGTFTAEEIEPRSEEFGLPPCAVQTQPGADANVPASVKWDWHRIALRTAIWLAFAAIIVVGYSRCTTYLDKKMQERADKRAAFICLELVAERTGSMPAQDCRLIRIGHGDSGGEIVYAFKIGPLPATGESFEVEFYFVPGDYKLTPHGPSVTLLPASGR